MEGKLYIWHGNKQFRLTVFSLEFLESDEVNSDYIKVEGAADNPHKNQNENLQSIIDDDAERVTVELTYTENGINKAIGCFPKGSQIEVANSEYTSLVINDCKVWKKTWLADSN